MRRDDWPQAVPAGRDDAALDAAVLAQRFVEQRRPGATVQEVQAFFESLLATAFAGATITQYLPILLWRRALERWPGTGTGALPA